MELEYKNFIYDEGRGFVFAYIPKVACTNWKSIMRYLAGYEDYLDTRLAHDKQNGGLRYLDLGNDADAAIVNDAAVRKFTVVRDPYSRALSAYLNKVENRLDALSAAPDEDHFRKALRDIDAYRVSTLGEAEFPEVNFEVFLRWLRNRGSWFTLDEHWAPQTTLLRWPDIQFDRIGHFENLAEDAAGILAEIDCDIAFPSQKDVKFAPTNARTKIDIYYDDATRALVEEIYAGDFIAFGYPHYSPPIPSSRSETIVMHLTDIRSNVIDEISPNDWMWKGNKDKDVYLNAGWSVGRALLGATITTEQVPARILDFGCGHGRVMRWLRAVYPDAELVASDRVRDGVDFCAKTFDAIPVYSNDTYEDINLGGNFDLIWLGSVYTHLPMNLWHKLTQMLVKQLAPKGLLAFSFAGPHVADRLIEGERNPNAEVSEDEFNSFVSDYQKTGFGYARHDGVGDREWGRSIISHPRVFEFLHAENLSIVTMGERLYDDRQDIVVSRPAKG